MARKKSAAAPVTPPKKNPDKTVRGADLGKKTTPMRERMAEDIQSKQHGK